MTLSMYQASLPVFHHQLGALSNILGKGEAYAKARGIAPTVLIGYRLAPDMLPLSAQVQIAADAAKGAAARLAGVESPSFADTETTFEELRARCTRTQAYLDGFTADQIDGSEEREVVLKLRDTSVSFKGQQYLLGFALPNFYFHVTTAYAILRHCGVDLGKRDFLGAV
jgi:hypothetical protein